MGVIERAIEIHYATFPRAPRDGRAHPFGAVDHEPYQWRVSRDMWDELTSLWPEWRVPTPDPSATDRLLGERIVIDDALPPRSLVLQPLGEAMG